MNYPEKLMQLVSDSVQEFFTSVGFPKIIELDPRDQKFSPEAASQLFSASLGMSGEKLKGAMVVFACPALLSATNPQREYVKTFTESDHADWIGEIANQIVGALKRKTAGYKADFLLSTPTVVRGQNIVLAKDSKAKPAAFWFDVGNNKIEINFSATLASDLNFDGPPESNNQAAGGDALLF